MHQRNIGYVPQQGILFQHLKVYQQLEIPLIARGWHRSLREKRCEELIDLLRLHAFVSAYPASLSGGEIQKTALARALSFRPEYLLLDEPTAALDTDAKMQFYQLLRAIASQQSLTILCVTHDRFFRDQKIDHRFRLEKGILTLI